MNDFLKWLGVSWTRQVALVLVVGMICVTLCYGCNKMVEYDVEMLKARTNMTK